MLAAGLVVGKSVSQVSISLWFPSSLRSRCLTYFLLFLMISVFLVWRTPSRTPRFHLPPTPLPRRHFPFPLFLPRLRDVLRPRKDPTQSPRTGRRREEACSAVHRSDDVWGSVLVVHLGVVSFGAFTLFSFDFLVHLLIRLYFIPHSAFAGMWNSVIHLSTSLLETVYDTTAARAATAASLILFSSLVVSPYSPLFLILPNLLNWPQSSSFIPRPGGQSTSDRKSYLTSSSPSPRRACPSTLFSSLFVIPSLPSKKPLTTKPKFAHPSPPRLRSPTSFPFSSPSFRQL